VTEVTRQEATFDVGVDELWAVLVDFEAYPTWAADLKQVDVLERDADGRGVIVRYRAAAMGRSASYTLRYDYDRAPHELPWVLVRGDIMRKLDGAYTLTPDPDDPGRTHVRYELEVDLVAPLPSFVKHRAELKIIHIALRELRAHLSANKNSA
jgi:uncharacterized membrane protein